ncbi:sensor histidine kinase [Phorcysia thermohydrogeniphila]|uniref:histidine kinase n=1 Tax=Phorcysia thermohydrogeniphila TaxID=936138 RepID=A0A4R1GI93_9BACT|nr:ATP-binding protein [Phorcysia thermohydrogeniphila]TCK06615.1 two-component system nitrogen regulation sensor histidine kinase NtrY [Phorcysia thermohydrogeniphila]
MRRQAVKILSILLGILVVGYFGTSLVSSLTGEFYLNNPLFHVLFALILILLTVLFAIFIRNLVLFFFPHFKTNLRLKIFTAFVLLILGPALFTIFLSSSVVNNGLDRLLRIQVKRIVNISKDTTEQFIQFISDDLKRKIRQLKGRKNVYPYTLKVYGVDGFLKVEGKRVRKVGNIPINPKEVSSLKESVSYTFLDHENKLLIVCQKEKRRAFCISKRLPDKLVKDIEKLSELHSNYESMVAYKTPIKALYTLTFTIMGIAVLFGALWFARYFEKRITIPIEALYRATQKISKGDLNVKVEEEASDELKHVIEAFNYMVEQLRALKHSLEESRRYMEQILNSITPAIITFDVNYRLVSCNRRARELFGFSGENRELNILELLSRYPELKKAVEELILKGERKTEVREEINGREKFLTVELIISPEISDRILIIEDVTDLVKAQKAQAWKEVARRIAHEIKNPLTPITLNAERIRRQFKKGNPEIGEIIDKAVDSILAEVEVIKRLIDEFRKFARLPLPEKKLSDVNSLIRSSLEPYENRVALKFELEDIPQIPLDRSLMREVLINLIENSIEAGATEVSVSTTSKDGKIFIVFKDNGPGIPEEIADKLFAPYVSTKEDGWGLGLSIVKKIVEDHGGKIYTIDRNTFVIELPV